LIRAVAEAVAVVLVETVEVAEDGVEDAVALVAPDTVPFREDKPAVCHRVLCNNNINNNKEASRPIRARRVLLEPFRVDEVVVVVVVRPCLRQRRV